MDNNNYMHNCIDNDNNMHAYMHDNNNDNIT